MSKYHARPVTLCGIRFDSTAEARRYAELRMLEQAGVVTELAVHKRYRLDVAGQHICDYIADFSYYLPDEERWVTEDVKGVRTPVYKLKAKLMRAIHGIEVVEVKA